MKYTIELDHDELNTLHVALMYSKFRMEDKKNELSSSPLVNNILRKVQKKLKYSDPFSLDEYEEFIEVIKQNIILQPSIKEKTDDLIEEIIFPFVANRNLKDEFKILVESHG